jgi:hypothetical protein
MVPPYTGSPAVVVVGAVVTDVVVVVVLAVVVAVVAAVVVVVVSDVLPQAVSNIAVIITVLMNNHINPLLIYSLLLFYFCSKYDITVFIMQKESF